MSATGQSNGRPSDPKAGEGVLSNLPRTRPQRSSPRRAAAREAAAARARTAKPGASVPRPSAKLAARAADAPAATAKAKPAESSKARPARGVKAAAERPPKRQARRAVPRPTVPPGDPVPRQGFESDFDRASGPVQPPGGTELLGAAAEIFGELAKAGFSTGERLLKDVLTRLPLS